MHVLKYFPAVLLIVGSFMGFLFICSDVQNVNKYITE